MIEDNPEDLKYVKSVLKSVRHDFDVATCQQEAQVLLEKHVYDYLLLDRELPFEPEGIKRLQNGDNLFEQIKRDPRHNATRIVIITAHDVSDPDKAVELIKQGAFDFIAKPFTSGRTKTVDRVVQRVASGLAAFHPAWQMITLMRFIEQCCVIDKTTTAKARKNALSYAAKNGQIVLPTPAVKRRQGQAALYFTKDLIVAWTEYRQAGVDVPPLKQEISALF